LRGVDADLSEKEKVRRNRPNVHVTLPRDVLEMLEELSRLSGWGRSRCIEECVRAAYPDMVRRLRALRGGAGANKDLEDAYWENEYWRRVILGDAKGREWTQAM
jgi:hypothetical protein